MSVFGSCLGSLAFFLLTLLCILALFLLSLAFAIFFGGK
jgi:hypothetical protein